MTSAVYDPTAFPPFAVTVDIVALTVTDALEVLLVERGEDPFAGDLALPGGFVLPHESVTDAAWRELGEETGLDAAALPGVHLEQLATFGAVGRDPRMRVVSVAHLALSPTQPEPEAGGDAAAAHWLPVSEVRHRGLAFDHAQILDAGLERARSKLEYTTLAAVLAGPTFTLGELQRVYEVIWDTEVERANFRRKVLSSPGFVEPTGERRTGRSGGAPAAVYRAGDGELITPPLLRPA